MTTTGYEMVKKAHTSLVRNTKQTISRNDRTVHSEMSQHATIRLVSRYGWRRPLGAAKDVCAISGCLPSIPDENSSTGFPPTFAMTSGADLTRAAVPYISQRT